MQWFTVMETTVTITERVGETEAPAKDAAGKPKSVPTMSHDQYQRHVEKWLDHYKQGFSFR